MTAAARRRHHCPAPNAAVESAAAAGAAADDSKADSGEVAPEPPRSDGNNARRADNNFPPQPDHQSFARRGQVGDIFRRREKLFRESLRPARWTRTFGIMDLGDVHPCGYDRAYVCSDRFSWFAVPPTP